MNEHKQTDEGHLLRPQEAKSASLCYADTVVWDTKPTPTLTALRFWRLLGACAGTRRRNLWRGYHRNRGR